MLTINGNSQIYLFRNKTDMRKSFCGLCTLVYQHRQVPNDGSYYVFVNRTKTHIKILYWDGDGLALWYKRLEKGTFVIPDDPGDTVVLERRQLAMLMEGIIPKKTKARFSRN